LAGARRMKGSFILIFLSPLGRGEERGGEGRTFRMPFRTARALTTGVSSTKRGRRGVWQGGPREDHDGLWRHLLPVGRHLPRDRRRPANDPGLSPDGTRSVLGG